jgi:hypothetical protein
MEPGDQAPESPQPRVESSADRYRRLLNDLRSHALEKTWNDRVKISGLLNDAGLNPDDYPLDGSAANTIWANLIPVLRDRGELAQVLRAVQPRVGIVLAETAEELASYHEQQARQLADKLACSRMRSHLPHPGGMQTRATPVPGQGEGGQRTLPVPTGKRIFLSHAFADKALANLVRDTLVLGGVTEARIFYSSARRTGIPSGEDVGSYLRWSLRDAGLVIELLSPTFLTRPMCLMELGGAWALGIPTYPIVVPSLRREEATRQIGNVQMGALGTDAEIGELFDELHDRLAEDLGIQVNLTSWNRSIAEFKRQLPAKLPPSKRRR